MHEFDEDEENHNYWPSVSDLFLTLFVIAIAIVGVVFVSLLPKDNVGDATSLVHGIGSKRDRLLDPVNRLRAKVELQALDKSLSQTRFLDALQETSVEAIRRLDAHDEQKDKIALYLEELALKDAKIKMLQQSLIDSQTALDVALNDTKTREQIQLLATRNIALQEQLSEKDRFMSEALETEVKKRQALIDENLDLKQLNDKPPNIQISEQNEDYRFAIGSSFMSTKFSQGLQQNEFLRLADEIISRNTAGRATVDTLEIIGHTDGAPISTQGNLDSLLPQVLTGEMTLLSSLRAGSNNDLGLLRAIAVRDQWGKFIIHHPQYEILKKIDVRCYSAGQTVSPHPVFPSNSQDLLKPDPAARRIEMRLTRLN